MLSFKVDGLSCGHCVQSVTQAVQKVAPNAQVAVDLEAGRVDVSGDDRRDALAAAIEEAGYKVAA